MTDEESMEKLPDLIKQLTLVNSESFNEYEKRIDKCLEKTMKGFEDMVDSGILSTDPQAMVEAVSVLTKAKNSISESKRRMIETTMRGLALNKAVKGDKPMTALDKWTEKQRLEGRSIEETASNGMFADAEVDDGE